MNDRTTTKQLPDLPGLESVDSTVSKYLAMMAFYVIFTAFLVGSFVYVYWMYRRWLGDQLALATGIVVLTSAMVVWVILRLLSGSFHWKTDAHGLTMRGPLRKRFVAWQDITNAVSQRGTSSIYYRLSTMNGAIGVNLESGSDSAALYASIRQHLGRLGKADGLELPEAALTFWDRIPDDLPRNIEWVNPRAPKLWAAAIPAIGMLAFVAYAGKLFFGRGNWFVEGFVAIMMAAALTMAWVTIRDCLQTALRVSLADDHIEIQTIRRTVVLPWSEVTRARWTHNVDGNCSQILIIGGETLQRAAVPHIASSDDSGKLILAIVRRLRTAGAPQALTIPEELRAQVGPARIGAQGAIWLGSDPVEVRFTIRERLLIMFFPCLVGLALILGDASGNRMPLTTSAPIALGILVVSWLMSGTWVVRADSEGVWKSFMGIGNLVRWDDVAEYSICPVFRRAVKNHRVLKNSNGKVLTELRMGFGTRESRDRFWEVLESRLSQTGPAAKPAEPWKARPWTLE